MTARDDSTHPAKTQKVGGDPFDMQSAEQALKTLRPKLDALDGARVQPLRAPVAQIVANILRVDRSLREDRGRLAAAFQTEAFRPAHYEDLLLVAQALWHADVKLRQLVDPKGISTELMAVAAPLKGKLLRAASYLWDDDPEVGPQVEEIRAGRGFLDLADDLVTLAGLFGAHWGFASRRCDITDHDLGEARRIASELVTAIVGRDVTREAAGREIAQVREVRDRAATYAREGVDEVRAAARFVYRHQPEAWAERYPSFFQGIGGRRRSPARPAPQTEAASSVAGSAEEPNPLTRPPVA